MKRLEPHPFAELLPMMSDGDYDALKADVVANGKFNEPAKRFQGKLLDGRNRDRVSAETSIELPIEDFKGSEADALRYVYSKAVHRNMSESQKAAAAVNFLPHFEAEAERRQKIVLKQGSRSGNISGTGIEVSKDLLVEGLDLKEWTYGLSAASREEVSAFYKIYVDPKAVDLSGRSCAFMADKVVEAIGKAMAAAQERGEARDFAGRLFGVSGRYVQDAKRIKDADEKLFHKIFEGRETISRAMREIKRHHKAKTLKAMARTHVKSVASSDRWKIITGDCIVELPKLPEKAKLIFEDPPYNLGLDYGRGAKADKKTPIEFRRYLGEWIDRSVEALTEDGSIFFMISAEHLHTVHGDLHVAGMHFRNIIAWVEAFGNYTDANFTSCWRPILYFTRSKERFTWHGDQILIPSDRQTKHADARANPAGKVPSNVWTEFPRLVDNAAERMPGFPTQIPAALVERIVLAASDPGDLVVDPFNGSGTTGAAAVKHHRRYIGIEEVEKNAAFARARLMTIQREMEAP